MLGRTSAIGLRVGPRLVLAEAAVRSPIAKRHVLVESRPATLGCEDPWATLVGPGLVFDKNRSFQRTATIRGPDLDSATPAELVTTAVRLNSALRRLGSGWAIFVEAQRIPRGTSGGHAVPSESFVPRASGGHGRSGIPRDGGRPHVHGMAFLEISERDRLDMTKLHASISDLSKAVTWAQHVMKKKWYRGPWSRGQTYSHQSAYITSIVMAYGRVFASGRNGRKFPEKLIQYDDSEWALHHRLLEMRNAVYAHSSLDRFTVKPWKVDDFETTVIGEPINKIEETDLERLIVMAERLRSAASKRYAEILRPYRQSSCASDSKASALDRAMEAIGQLEVGEAIAIPITNGPA